MNKYDLPYIDEIMIIQETLEVFYESKSSYGYNYLKNKCQETTRLTKIILPNLEEKAGMCYGQWHALNIDPIHNIIIDLSGWQFEGLGLSPTSCVLPINHKKYKPCNKALEKHLKSFDSKKLENNLIKLIETHHEIKKMYIV